MAEKSSASTQGITRLFTIIETMASIGHPVRLQEIAQQSGASPSTVMRILNAMIESGYAVQDPETQFYSLSFKFLQIGNSIRENATINSLIHPYLYRITSETGISSALSIRNDNSVSYIDEVVSQTNMVRVHHHLGVQFPLYNTAAGKLFLSAMAPAEFNRYILSEKMVSSTATTLTTRRKLEENLMQIKSQGYACNDEEAVQGLRCLAFPLYDDINTLFAVISISGTIYQINEGNMDSLIKVVGGIVDELMEKCGPMLTSANRNSMF